EKDIAQFRCAAIRAPLQRGANHLQICRSGNHWLAHNAVVIQNPVSGDAELRGIGCAFRRLFYTSRQQRMPDLFNRKWLLIRPGSQLGQCVSAHAYFLPAGPVDRDSEGIAVVVMGEGVEKRVGRAIIRLAKSAEDRTARRTEREEIQLLAFEYLCERASPLHFGSQTAGRRLRRLQLDHAAAGHARRVDYAVNRAEARDHVSHPFFIRYIGAENQYLGPEIFDRTEFPNLVAHRVLFIMRGQPFIPALSLWKSGTSCQDQFCSRDARQMFRQLETDPTRPAGDEIDAARPQPQRALGRSAQRHWFEGLRPAMMAAVGDHNFRRLRTGGDFRDELLNQPLIRPSSGIWQG